MNGDGHQPTRRQAAPGARSGRLGRARQHHRPVNKGSTRSSPSACPPMIKLVYAEHRCPWRNRYYNHPPSERTRSPRPAHPLAPLHHADAWPRQNARHGPVTRTITERPPGVRTHLMEPAVYTYEASVCRPVVLVPGGITAAGPWRVGTQPKVEPPEENPRMDLDSENPAVSDLIAAIRGGDLPTVHRLLGERPALATARFGGTSKGRTALHIATDWPGYYPAVSSARPTCSYATARTSMPLPATPRHGREHRHGSRHPT